MYSIDRVTRLWSRCDGHASAGNCAIVCSLHDAAGSVLLDDDVASVKPLLRRLQRQTDVSFARMLWLSVGLQEATAAEQLGCVAVRCAGLGLTRDDWHRALAQYETQAQAQA
jgi:hypothetical protein